MPAAERLVTALGQSLVCQDGFNIVDGGGRHDHVDIPMLRGASEAARVWGKIVVVHPRSVRDGRGEPEVGSCGGMRGGDGKVKVVGVYRYGGDCPRGGQISPTHRMQSHDEQLPANRRGRRRILQQREYGCAGTRDGGHRPGGPRNARHLQEGGGELEGKRHHHKPIMHPDQRRDIGTQHSHGIRIQMP